MANIRKKRIAEALSVLADLGMPRAQQNERSALCLLAILDLTPDKPWREASNPLMGITPIMDWARKHYGKRYQPNSRESFRRRSIHQFVQGGISLLNPDLLDRPVNSQDTVYQIEPNCLRLVRSFDTDAYKKSLSDFVGKRGTLAAQYAMDRNMKMVPIRLSGKQTIRLSPGAHSKLIQAVCEEFGPRFAPDGRLIYVGDTGKKWGYFDEALLTSLGVNIDNHGKMPDVVIYCAERNWLILVEAVTSHGPIDAKRYNELSALFSHGKAGLVFLSAFPNRKAFTKYMNAISWETEVWITDSPTHLIHFNGSRFLGPYKNIQ